MTIFNKIAEDKKEEIMNITKKKFLFMPFLFFVFCLSFFLISVLFLNINQSDQVFTTAIDASEWWIGENNRENSFAGGEGTAESPYLIENAGQLAYLSYMVYTSTSGAPVTNTYNIYEGVYFKQIADIDLSGFYWQPIGTYYNREGTTSQRYFAGIFDGNNYTINGINTLEGSDKSYSYQGLFGYVNQGNLKNIIISNSTINGYCEIGGIVGYVVSSQIKNCSVIDCCINGVSDVGGVIAYAESSKIINCSNSITSNNNYEVNATGMFAGGIVGATTGDSANIVNCYNSVKVSGGFVSGGIIGIVGGYSGKNLILSNCYNTGNVEGKTIDFLGQEAATAGGVIGGFITTSGSGSSIILNCFNLGSVSIDKSGENSVTGGVIGVTAEYATVMNCYYGGDCQTGGIGGVDQEGMATRIDDVSLFKTKDFYQDQSVWTILALWDFNYTWGFVENQNNGYPVIVGQSIPLWTDEGVRASSFSGGDGTKENPYLISSGAELGYLSYLVFNSSLNEIFSDTYFELTCDIDLSGYYWQSIGYALSNTSTGDDEILETSIDFKIFSGNFNGNGYKITNLIIPQRSSMFSSYSQGLFGAIKGSTIENVIVYGEIQDISNLAGITGIAYESNINSCSNFVNLQGYINIGGIVGYSESSNITNSSNYGSINGISFMGMVAGSNLGGIAGNVINCNFNHCSNVSTISGSDGIGGIVGQARAEKKTITIDYCYSSAELIGYDNVGGILGDMSSDMASLYINYCGFEGVINCQNSQNCGAIFGGNNYPTIKNCFAIANMGNSNLSKYGTQTNCIAIITVGETQYKFYKGTDFSAFIWINENSCPVIKELSWAENEIVDTVTEQQLIDKGFVSK